MKRFGKVFMFFAVLAVLGGLAGCASVRDVLSDSVSPRIAALERQTKVMADQVMDASAQAATKAGRAEVAIVRQEVAVVASSQAETAKTVAEVSKQVASVAASQKETASSLAETAKALAEVKAKTDANAAAIAGHGQTVTGLKQAVDGQGKDIAGHGQAVTGLKKAVDGQGKDIAEVKKTVDGHGKDIARLTSRADKADTWVKNVLAGIGELQMDRDKTNEAVADMGRSVDGRLKQVGDQIAGVKKQVVAVKYVTGTGHDEIVYRVEGFALAKYDESKDELTAGCAELTAAQKKQTDEEIVKVLKANTNLSIRSVKGLASIQPFVKAGKALEKSGELNQRCALVRAATVAQYLADATKAKVGYVGLGSVADFGPHARNRAVMVQLTNSDDARLTGWAEPKAKIPAPPAPKK